MPRNKTTNASLARFKSLGALLLGAAIFTACVTVNVNFPESAVQKASDDYVRDLYRAKEKGKSPAPEATAAKPAAQSSAFPAFELNFDLLPSALADVNVKVDSPKALAIKQKLASRVDDVLAQKRAGALGETNDGLLALKGTVKPLLKQKIDSLISGENADRMALYEEVARANSIPTGRIKDIQKSFARSFQAESPSGTWFQSDAGGWSQKP